MLSRLTKYEKETVLLYNQSRDPITISTYDPGLRRRLREYAARYNTLVSGANWDPRKLLDIQNFLDEANAILKPILPECSGSGEGGWYISKLPFAYGTWEWTTNGFRIIGTEL